MNLNWFSHRSKRVPQSVRRLLDYLNRNKKTLKRFLILTHDNPDPDALASALALRYLLKQEYGISSLIAYGGVVGRMENRNMVEILKLPIHPLKASYLKSYQHVALVDTQPTFNNNPFPRERRATLVIDQHRAAVKSKASLTIVDTQCGATCVILAQALIALKIEIPSRIATAIAYGILSETLQLHRGTTDRVIDTYLKILPRSNMRAIASIQNPMRSQNFFKSLNRGIYDAQTYQGLIVTHLGQVENPDLVAQVADFLLTYRGVRWSLCTGRYQGRLHLSLRSERPKSDAGKILRDVLRKKERAGGHGTIAGGSMTVGKHVSQKKWKKIEHTISRRLAKRLRMTSGKHFSYAFRE